MKFDTGFPMKKQTALILVGIQASGKSTFAKMLAVTYPQLWERINYDEIRHDEANGLLIDGKYRFSKQSEAKVKEIAEERARQAFREGKSIVVDNTNLTFKAQNYWMNLAREYGAYPELKQFNTNLDECIRRNATRTGWQHVPRPVIERAALMHGLIDWPKNKKAVIVDMDGTLADSSVRVEYVKGGVCDLCDGTKVVYRCRYASTCDCEGYEKCGGCKGTGKIKKDWKRFFGEVGNDKPRKEIAFWIDSLKDTHYIIVVSGRPLDQCGQATVEWLAKHNIHYDRIFMRPAGTNHDAFRPDTEIKKDILDQIRMPIAFAIDDRPSVIRMWQENGIHCYDVGDGKEF